MRKPLETVPPFELAEALLEHLDNSNAIDFIGDKCMREIVAAFTKKLAEIDA